ncbi:winged helix-turn-helix transcriptional regulator [Candidatus Bathyarchaeota archaeon]|nr:winged helix-turn-helix transcriptional regulator [Candidatus Bathyarchaeota archaeon]
MIFANNIEAFKAMGSESRQLILGAIERGVKNPGRIGRELGMPRSTVEKHLRILLKADLVSKVPVLNEENRISVSYEINQIAIRLREAVKI